MVTDNEKDRLANDLDGFGDVEWADAARDALKDPMMQYVGQSTTKPTTDARELEQIYQRRLTHCRKAGLKVLGIEVLLRVLSDAAATSGIRVKPFISPTRAVTAFYQSDGKLIACVTVERNPEDSGKDSFAYAIGG